MRKHLYINDVDICEFGIYISSDTYLNSPLIDYKEYQIPARDGTVIQYNKRLNNVVRRFDCYIPEIEDVKLSINKLNALLYNNVGYVKLVSDYDNAFYQYGYLAQEIEVEPFQYNHTASFTLYFSCLPKKYLIDGGGTVYDGDFQASYYRVVNEDSDIITKIVRNNTLNSYNDNLYVLFPNGAGGINVGEDITISFESNNIQKYSIVLVSIDTSTNDKTYSFIGDVFNYGATLQFTSPSSYQQFYTLYVVCEINNDINISAIGGTDINWRYELLWNEYGNIVGDEYIVGNNLEIYLNEYVNRGTTKSANARMNIYDDEGNEVNVVFNFESFTNDYGAEYISTNFAHGYDIYYYLNVNNNILYIVDSFGSDTPILDISNYLNVKGDISKFKQMKFKLIGKVDGGAVLLCGDFRRAQIKANWWSI